MGYKDIERRMSQTDVSGWDRESLSFQSIRGYVLTVVVVLITIINHIVVVSTIAIRKKETEY